MDGQQQDKPDDIETAKRERHDLGLRIVEFVLGHIAKTGDNPAAGVLFVGQGKCLFGIVAFEFVLGRIAKTGDNPAAEKAQSLLDELRKVETQG